ncbi:hypothetical protein [Bradyrhizobium sp. ORS 285]|uniref:hypothetical protein n=1 Tax=Bradyrhizobium sp. ORS 285 TaxID=115808 RepID=UPI0011128017|nr:hypothetical protein [Bradyrhizobium sp. ORS 285]
MKRIPKADLVAVLNGRFRDVKAWAIIRQSKLETEQLQRYHFEDGLKKPPRAQDVYVISPNRNDLKRYKAKWLGGAESMRIVPCRISYTIPKPRKSSERHAPNRRVTVELKTSLTKNV